MQSEKITKLSAYLARLSSYGTAFGANNKPFVSIDQLNSVDTSTLDRTMSLMENRLKSLELIEIENDKQADIQDELVLFNEALKHNGLHSKDDVTSFFNFGDIIEIYGPDFTQLYGNLQFMKFCSYDLFTLYTTPFYELYSRGKEYDEQIKEIMTSCFSSFQKTEKFAVDPHILREVHKKNNKLFKVHPKWISPLFDKNEEVKACVITNYCIEYKVSAVN